MAKLRPLPPKLEEAAKEEVFEDPARLEADLQHIKDWLAKQPHLKPRTNDQFLVAFLRGCKFSLERTKEKLESYYTLRSALPEYFSKRDPTTPEIRKILQIGIFLPLGVDSEGRRVMLMRSTAYNPSQVSPANLFKCISMIMDMLILEDDTLLVKGHVSINDLANMSMAHATQMTPSLAKRMATVIQEGYPFRPKAFHYLNLNPLFNSLYSLMKTFMKQKLQDRINVHPDLESLYKCVPKEILPNEYGGSAGTIKEMAGKLEKRLEALRDHFLEDEKFGVDESKRPGKPKTHEDLFGIEGSFRKLDVD